MNKQKQLNDPMLSRTAAWWFYIAIILALLCYATLLGVSGHGVLFEPQREFFMHVMIVLAGVNGLIALILTLRRKLCGPYWGLIPLVPVCLTAMDLGYGATLTSDDIPPMMLLISTPTLLLLGQIPTLKKLKNLGPGWGLGAMAYTNPEQVSRAAVWWFRIACIIAFLFYLLLLIVPCGIMINEPYQPAYSLYMASIAGAAGLYALLLLLKKNIFGSFCGLMPCIFLALGMKDLGFGRADAQFIQDMLPFAIFAAIILLSQIPYLKKLAKRSGSGAFQKAHFTNGASFADQDLADLNSTWSSYSGGAVLFDIPGMALAILGGQILSRSIGGFVGNFSAVALLFAMLFFAFFMNRARKKRYQECRDKLGLTDEDIRQALQHKRKGTVADDKPAPSAAQ